MKENPLLELRSLGQSVWLDFLHRGMMEAGELARMIRDDGLGGVTSNPAIFEKAIAGSHDYDAAIRGLALAGKHAAEIYEVLTVEDVQRAADLLRPVYDSLGGRDGFVSLEVSPHLAYDTAGTAAEARRLWGKVSRPNVFIKIPGTLEGLPAIQQCLGEGININVTLLFGLPRYRQVADAYLGGMEALAKRGGPLERTASVASFFLSRIDSLVDPMLEEKKRTGDATAATLVGQTAIASAKVAYTIYKEMFAGDRFRRLAASGARTQRLLWASTSTKNPAYPDTKYVEPLIGPDTVNTMPLETIAAYRDHGRPAARLEEGAGEAERTLDRLKSAGIDLGAVTQQLESEGVQKFIQPYDSLLQTLERASQAARAGAVGV